MSVKVIERVRTRWPEKRMAEEKARQHRRRRRAAWAFVITLLLGILLSMVERFIAQASGWVLAVEVLVIAAAGCTFWVLVIWASLCGFRLQLVGAARQLSDETEVGN